MKLSTQILTASLLPFIFLTTSYYLLTKHSFTSHLDSLYLSQTETKLIQIEENFRSFIRSMEDQLKFFAAIRPPDESQVTSSRINFLYLLQGSESIFQVSAINTKGREWLRVEQFPSGTDNQLLNLFSSPIYLQPMLSLAVYTDKVKLTNNFPTPFLDISLPVKIYNTGELSGVLWAKISLQEIQVFLEQFIPVHGKIMLLEGTSGNTLVKADATGKDFIPVEQKIIHNIIKSDRVKGVEKSNQTDLEATFVFRKFTVNNLDFIIVSYQPNEQIYYLANRLNFNTNILLLAGLIIFFISSFLLIRKIIQPLTQVTNNLSLLKEQYRLDKNYSIETKPGYKNEIEQLQQSFFSFSEHLQIYRAQIKEFNQTLEAKIKEWTQELENTQDMLRHSEKLSAIGRLSASIAHEINNPIYGIQSVIEGLKLNKYLDKEDIAMADLALSECSRVKNLISDLQSFNRPSPGVKKVTDLHELLNTILLICRKSFKEHKISIKKEYCADILLIPMIPDQMKQVFLNILNNAQDSFSDLGGTITISTELEKPNIIIKIKDTGSGISAENINHIFDPFFTTKPEVKGTGLGLSVSYGIVKNHDGKITVDSTIGSGTTFSIILPIN